MGDYVDIAVKDGSFRAFVAYPAVFPAPAVVVLHEVFGVNNDMRESCRKLAGRGFIAIAPDLFWRQEAGLDLSHWTPEEWEKGLALYRAYDRDQGAMDIAMALSFARKLKGSTGRVGLMGYCLGGLMTVLVTARHGADVSIAYYPGSAEDYIAEAPAISSPMIVHLAEDDEFISGQAQAAIKEALGSNPSVEIFSYPGCSHAFARHSGTRYDRDAAALANSRTWSFLDRQLK